MNYKAVLKIALEVNDKLRNIIKNESYAVLDEDLRDRLIFLDKIKGEFTPCVYVIKAPASDEYATKGWSGWTTDINKARIFSNPGHAKTSNTYKRNPNCRIVKVELKEV